MQLTRFKLPNTGRLCVKAANAAAQEGEVLIKISEFEQSGEFLTFNKSVLLQFFRMENLRQVVPYKI